MLGNERAWLEVRGRVEGRPWEPLIISGATGVGKTRGVDALVGALCLRGLWLDGAEAETGAQMVAWVARTRRMRTDVDGRRPAVVVDGLETLTEDACRQLGKYLESVAGDLTLHPLLITCTELRRPSLRAVARLCARKGASQRDDGSAAREVRLRTPDPSVVRTWLRDHRGVAPGLIAHESDALRGGDLRRALIAVEWRARMGGALAARTPAPGNAFDATRRLIAGTLVWQWWAANVEARDVDIVCEHAVRLSAEHGAADLDSLADVCEHTSAALTIVPDRYETRHAVGELPRAVVALAVSLKLRARETGALGPPPRAAAASGPLRPDSRQIRPWSESDARDVPAPLRAPRTAASRRSRT